MYQLQYCGTYKQKKHHSLKGFMSSLMVDNVHVNLEVSYNEL